MTTELEEVEDRSASRKWILAKRVFVWATFQHLLLQLMIYCAMVVGKLPPDAWSKAVQDLAMTWVWAVGAVLGLYGLANVAAIKFRSDGGVS